MLELSCENATMGIIEHVLPEVDYLLSTFYESTIDSEGFKGGTRGAPIMPRDAVSRTAHVGTVGKNGLRGVFH